MSGPAGPGVRADREVPSANASAGPAGQVDPLGLRISTHPDLAGRPGAALVRRSASRKSRSCPLVM
jgi:hypothetical protein